VADMNTVDLVGRLTKDMELKYTHSGTAIGEFALANNYRVKKGENWEDAVSYIDCTMIGRRAESLAQYMGKGARIGITGELRQDRWETKDGQKRSKMKVFVRDVQLLGSGRSETSQTATEDNFDDDVPF